MHSSMNVTKLRYDYGKKKITTVVSCPNCHTPVLLEDYRNYCDKCNSILDRHGSLITVKPGEEL